uniref:Eukaryotic translation initiation factor 3 subunit G N-terminal domain-containing protein n=1 Tax=Ditylenchus dipsaci TaxID=166011 RepID=A0A915EDY0_9BILA
MVNATANSQPLGNIGNMSSIQPSIGNWADAVEESQLNAASHKRTEVTKNGIKTVVDIVDDKDSGKCRVVTTYKVITKKVPRAVAERKSGRTDEVQMIFTRNRAGETQEQENEDKKNDPMKGYASKGHCRICKADDHWSVNCPYKEMYQTNEEDASGADNKSGLKQIGGGTGIGGRYVAPHARGDRVTTGLTERRSDDFTCRVTNLPEDSETLEEDLRSMFGLWAALRDST